MLNAAIREFVGRECQSADAVSLDIYQILEKAKCPDGNVKREIDALLRSDNIWFPELLAYYPGDQGKALRFMFEEWQSPLPMDVVVFIAKYYYSVSDLQGNGGGNEKE